MAPIGDDNVFVLVTGANSGLGYSICCRLADEFLSSDQNYARALTIIFTTRSSKKGSDTLRGLQSHLRNSSSPDTSRVSFVPENVDLTNLLSVRALSRRLNNTYPKLDALVLNAGIGGWTGLNWFRAVWTVLTDTVHATTWPTYKLAPAGLITENQTSCVGDKEPRLGTVFCANVLGHYMLAHNVMPLLHHRKAGALNGNGHVNGNGIGNGHGQGSGSGSGGRVIWVSSLEGTIKFLDAEDLQGLKTTAPYEASKALTDVLALTADLPSTAPWVRSFYSLPEPGTAKQDQDQDASSSPPKTYLSHPGICSTSILPIPTILVYGMTLSFWLARLLGSPWHTLSTYLGAHAPVWLALSRQDEIAAAEEPYRQAGGGHAKWGSAATLGGVSSIASTEVDGWGHGGVVGRGVKSEDLERRRKRGAVDLTGEEKERFVGLGREAWRFMEELRVEWEGILDEEERVAGVTSD